MAYSEEEWMRVKAYYEAGFTVASIVERPDIKIKSPVSIYKRSKKDGWIKGSTKELIEKECYLKPELKKVQDLKYQKSRQEVEIINDLVAERLTAIQFLDNAALENTRQAMTADCNSQFEFKARADTISKSKETIVGKSPDNLVQVNNNAEPHKIVFEVIDTKEQIDKR